MYDLSPYSLYGRNYLAPAVGTQLAAENPSRRILSFSVNGAGWSVYVDTRALTFGIYLTSSLSPLLLTWDEHGPLATSAWYVGTSVVGQTILVGEVYYRPGLHVVDLRERLRRGAVSLRGLLSRCTGSGLKRNGAQLLHR